MATKRIATTGQAGKTGPAKKKTWKQVTREARRLLPGPEGMGLWITYGFSVVLNSMSACAHAPNGFLGCMTGWALPTIMLLASKVGCKQFLDGCKYGCIPAIAVSLFMLALSVTHCTQALKMVLGLGHPDWTYTALAIALDVCMIIFECEVIRQHRKTK